MAEGAFNNTTAVDLNEYGLAYLVPEWTKDILTAYLMVVFFLGIPGNGLVILVQVKNKQKSVTDWFVLFMAVSDNISLLVCVPTYTVINQGKWITFGNDVWCKIHYFVVQLTILSSTYLIVSVSLDRLFKTTGNKLYTAKRAIYTGVFIYLFSAGWNILILFSTENNSLGQCMIDFKTFPIQLYFLGISSILTTVSCVVLTVIYVKIILKVRANVRITALESNVISREQNDRPVVHTQNSKIRQRDLRTTRVIALVASVFVLSTSIPSTAGLALGPSLDLKQNVTGRIVLFLLTKLYMINNCANPLFYLWLYPSFRKRLAGLLFSK